MFLGLDLGTTNVKAVVADAHGRVVARGAAPVELIHGPDGAVEQDIEAIASAAVSAIAAAGAGADLSAVQAVGVSAQGGALQVLDGDDKPVGRVVSWLDGRGRRFDEQIARDMGADNLAARTGHPRGTMALGQLLRLREQSPALLAAPNRIGLVGDVMVGRLCGRRAHDATSLSCAVLLNPSLGRADPDMLARVGLAEDQLPDLLGPREAAGGLSEAVAQATSRAASCGLPVGVPVSPAVHDQYAAALGVRATAPGDVMFGAGTAWSLTAVADRLVQPLPDAGFVCTHLAEGRFGQIVSMGNGGSSVAWALALIGLKDADGETIDDLLASVPPGADGLRFWPFLAPTGGAGLAPGTAGRLDGLRLAHGPGHLLRGVVEGLALELARYLRLLAEAGMPAERLIMCGGAAGSRVTPQIVADAASVPVTCSAEADTSALGAAMLAAGLLAPDTPLAEIAAAMAPPDRPVAPGPEAKRYRDMLDEYLAAIPLAGGGPNS